MAPALFGPLAPRELYRARIDQPSRPSQGARGYRRPRLTLPPLAARLALPFSGNSHFVLLTLSLTRCLSGPQQTPQYRSRASIRAQTTSRPRHLRRGRPLHRRGPVHRAVASFAGDSGQCCSDCSHKSINCSCVSHSTIRLHE